MRYSHAMTYDADPATVYAMLVDQEFQARRATTGNPESSEARVERGPGDAATVTVTRRISQGVPSFVAKLAGGSLTLTELFRWPEATDAAEAAAHGRSGRLDAAIEGQPAGVTGTLALAASGGRTTVTLEADIKVRVPLVGGKIERFVAEMLDKLMRAEHDLGRAWLAA